MTTVAFCCMVKAGLLFLKLPQNQTFYCLILLERLSMTFYTAANGKMKFDLFKLLSCLLTRCIE